MMISFSNGILTASTVATTFSMVLRSLKAGMMMESFFGVL